MSYREHLVNLGAYVESTKLPAFLRHGRASHLVWVGAKAWLAAKHHRQESKLVGEKEGAAQTPVPQGLCTLYQTTGPFLPDTADLGREGELGRLRALDRQKEVELEIKPKPHMLSGVGSVE